MNIFRDKFATGATLGATELSNATLQSWLKRDLILGHKEDQIEGGGSRGAYRRFSFCNVMALAIAKELIDAGVGSVPAAISAGISFSHIVSEGPDPERMPALPFDTRTNPGLTVLAMAGGVDTSMLWQPGKDILPIIRQRLGRPHGFVLLQIDPIFQRVTHRLGYDFRQVLEAAYPGQPVAAEWDDAAIAKLIAEHE